MPPEYHALTIIQQAINIVQSGRTLPSWKLDITTPARLLVHKLFKTVMVLFTKPVNSVTFFNNHVTSNSIIHTNFMEILKKVYLPVYLCLVITKTVKMFE